ncbi:MAG: TPM domain-containing protein [Edaphobacter sp.]
MKCTLRWLAIVLLVLSPAAVLTAETVNSLPAPTGYVNDFAGVLSPATVQSVDNLCGQVDRQAHAQIAVVTIKTIDGDQSIEEFATALEEKWKVGAKGTDRGVLMLLVMNPRRGRIEVGYGLEGILNDAKVGDIGRSMAPAARQGDYDRAVPLGVGQIAQIIAADAGVTLTQPMRQYSRQQQPVPVQLNLWQVLLAGGAILFVLFILIRTGNVGVIFFLLGALMGGGRGGRGGGGGDGDGGGGGFGGFGGGSSGGGGASGDF